MKNYQSQHEPIFFTPPSGDVKRPRTLHKGGGGGDGGAAARAAEEKARVAEGIKRINEVFGTSSDTPEALSAAQQREKLYSTISEDAKKKALIDLEKERAITERELNFSLARNGLSGGSRDVDANKDVLDTTQQGILKASEMGLSTANDARSNDEKTRVNLINSIQSGLDSGSAVQSAYTGLANNANIARDNANAISLTGFFDTLRANQQAAQYNQSYQDAINNQKLKIPYSTVTQSSRGGNGSDQDFL